ncbi:MAG TPA: hypothetical protein DCQ30_08580 [Acidimicrobiaceae bacterium]|nr:hypothetical protein [Acidimicrobiaceae bacterium]
MAAFTVVGVLAAVPTAASASNWVASVAAGSGAQAQSSGLPSPPASVTAACTSAASNTIVVTWSAVANAATFSVYEATAAASGPYRAVATGVTSTSWTSGGLSSANYWFEVTAYLGTNWQSVLSTASAESTTTHSGKTKSCTQP